MIKKYLFIFIIFHSIILAIPSVSQMQNRVAESIVANDLRDALMPVPKEAIFKMDGFYLWDPSVIKVGKTYHLFASRWPESTGMSGWKKSHIIRATSKSLFGPYTFAEVVFDLVKHPWATEAMHNPKVMKVGKKFLLYHLGMPLWQTGFAFADHIEGPWTAIKKPVIATNNPAIMIKPDGKIYVVGKFKPKDIALFCVENRNTNKNAKSLVIRT